MTIFLAIMGTTLCTEEVEMTDFTEKEKTIPFIVEMVSTLLWVVKVTTKFTEMPEKTIYMVTMALIESTAVQTQMKYTAVKAMISCMVIRAKISY